MRGTTNFQIREFRCPCCGQVEVSPRLLVALEDLRVRIGHLPIIVTSGYRCLAHNQEVGGSSRSLHLKGQAADIVVHGFSPDTLYEFARLVPAFRDGGIGRYPKRGHLHVDVRVNGPARWVN